MNKSDCPSQQTAPCEGNHLQNHDWSLISIKPICTTLLQWLKHANRKKQTSLEVLKVYKKC